MGKFFHYVVNQNGRSAQKSMPSVNIAGHGRFEMSATETQAVEGIEKAATATKATKPRRKFVGTATPKASSSKIVRRVANQIPDDILHDAELNAAIKGESLSLTKLWSTQLMS